MLYITAVAVGCCIGLLLLSRARNVMSGLDWFHKIAVPRC